MSRDAVNVGKKLENCVAGSFYKYGVLVGRYPRVFLIAPIILFFCCIPGLFWLRINLDLYKLFVPGGAPVRYEFERQQDFNRIPSGNLDGAPPPPALVPLAKHKRQIEELGELKEIDLRAADDQPKQRGRKRILI